MSVEAWLWRFPSALMAWRNLGRNRARTALAALGIVIGVVAIASLGMAGASIQYSTNQELGGLANQVTVTAGEDNPEPALTESQVRNIERLVADADVIAQKTGTTTIDADGEPERVSVTGLTQAGALYDAQAGEVPDRLRSGALVSSTVADEFGLEIGDPIEYDGQLYRIRGILEPQQGFGGGASVVLPVSALADQEYYSTVTIVAEDGAAAEAVANRVERGMNGREEIVSVTTLAAVQESIDSLTNTLNLALIGIGSISLVVAAVSILNVMLMSTIERRGEIGVLRAVGIRRGEVLRMILTEAGLLGVIGGAVGAVVALGVGLLLNQVLFNDPTLVFEWASMQYLVFGFAFAVVASLLSGLYPAWKAANERPVETLRG
ncbi:ABC transporter permease [Halolamina salina]|uniref:ABC transporter permease n=1 Tax=Halolamina salina TaxID=1220023 RepID=A0ABD6B4D3_9EURY